MPFKQPFRTFSILFLDVPSWMSFVGISKEQIVGSDGLFWRMGLQMGLQMGLHLEVSK